MFFQPIHHRLTDISYFMLSKSLYSLSVLFKRTNNLDLFYQIIWCVEFQILGSGQLAFYMY